MSGSICNFTLTRNEPGDGSPRRSCAGEEGLEFVADDLMEKGLLGRVTFVPVDGEGSSGTGLKRRGEGVTRWSTRNRPGES